MLTLLHSCTHFTGQQSNAQNYPHQTSTIREQNISRCISWIQKRQRSQRSSCQIQQIIEKAGQFQKNIYLCFIDYAKVFDCVDHNELWKILQVTGIPDHITYLLRNLYAGQEATVRPGHETMEWLQIGKGVHHTVYNLLAYLTYMQSTSCEMLDWMKHKLESRWLGEISTTSDTQMTQVSQHYVNSNKRAS